MQNFSVASASLTLNHEAIGVSKNITVSLNLNSLENVKSVILDYGDSQSNVTFFNINQAGFSDDFYHSYSSKGNYSISANFRLGGKIFSIQKNITVINENDTIAPSIDLIYPSDNAKIKNSSITFSYSASDNVALRNCTFSLYNSTNTNGLLTYSASDRVYQVSITSPVNDKINNITLDDFDQRDYYWEVLCYDNSSNYNFEASYFNVNLSEYTLAAVTPVQNTSYAQEEEVSYLISAVDNFLEKESSFNSDQLEVLNDLGISKELDYNKKRLIQIDQDFKYNLNFISDTSLREKKRNDR